MRLFPLLAVSLLVSTSASSQPSSRVVTEFGYGGRASCATWLSDPKNQNEGVVWILGFWSGLNEMGDNPDVGKNTDVQGIVAEVRKVCTQEPSLLLFVATSQVYIDLRRQGR